MRVILRRTKKKLEDEIILSEPIVELSFDSPLQAEIFACIFTDCIDLANYLKAEYSSRLHVYTHVEIANQLEMMLDYKSWDKIVTHGARLTHESN